MASLRHQTANQLRVELESLTARILCPTFSEIRGLNMSLKQSVAVERRRGP